MVEQDKLDKETFDEQMRLCLKIQILSFGVKVLNDMIEQTKRLDELLQKINEYNKLK